MRFLTRYRLLSGLVSLSALLAQPANSSAEWSLFRKCKPACPTCPAVPEAPAQKTAPAESAAPAPPAARPQPQTGATPPDEPKTRSTAEPNRETNLLQKGEPKVEPKVAPKVEPKIEPKVEPKLAQPPAVPLDAQPEPVTSAALGSAQVSINMFGDSFGKGGKSVVATFTQKSFTNWAVFDAPGGKQQLLFGPNTFGGNTVFFLSTPNQPNDADSVKKGDVIALLNNQPNAPAGSQQIVNGTAVITQPANSVILPAFANGTYFVLSRFEVDIPNPGAGGVVGRPRLSEDLNPLPRDRFIFNYDYFDQTQLAANGQSVNRYVLGFEKTFLDMRSSIEVRMPFASTLSSDIVVGTQNTRTEFGDVRILFKGLLYGSDRFYLASGLGVYLPTGQDVNVSLAGTPLVHIANRSVIVTPYVGMLFLPTDRLFAQLWAAIDVDTNGCPVDVANGVSPGMSFAGRIQDQALMQWDAQVGYWLRRPYEGGGVVRGFAPFAELHYGTTVTNADILQSNAFVIGNLTNRIDEMNASAGFATQLFDNLLLMVGMAAPMRRESDRGFDYQIGVRCSWFFGPTAAQRRAATFVQGF